MGQLIDRWNRFKILEWLAAYAPLSRLAIPSLIVEVNFSVPLCSILSHLLPARSPFFKVYLLRPVGETPGPDGSGHFPEAIPRNPHPLYPPLPWQGRGGVINLGDTPRPPPKGVPPPLDSPNMISGTSFSNVEEGRIVSEYLGHPSDGPNRSGCHPTTTALDSDRNSMEVVERDPSDDAAAQAACGSARK